MDRWQSGGVTQHDIAGIVALVLAGGTSIGFAGTLLLLTWEPSSNPASIQLVATLGGAIVGALATYLGARATEHSDRVWMRRADLEQTQEWKEPPG
jgi:membrane protein YqaA with SNARE-associated domain